MYKKIGIISVGVIIIMMIFIFNQSSRVDTLEPINANIVMPTKSSRPGCEIKDSCYIPSVLTIRVGESVSWQNQDVAYHTVTSGLYDNPDGLFNSGHLDPNQSFSITFDKKGNFNYYCTLHPWMKGKIIVEN